ncbi:hypothetical protein D5272_12165 [bacterium D16-76]|nr:hypothetical protein [bacterium D16-76]
MKGSAAKIQMSSLDDLFGGVPAQAASGQIQEIPLAELHPDKESRNRCEIQGYAIALPGQQFPFHRLQPGFFKHPRTSQPRCFTGFPSPTQCFFLKKSLRLPYGEVVLAHLP